VARNETFKEETKKGFSKPAPGCSARCGGYIGKDSPGNEEASSSCCNETSRITAGASNHKQEKEEITDCVYKIPRASCEKCYIGETGRKFGIRLKEHKTGVESITNKPFTRNQRASSLSEQNKSALTDRASHDNHVINWPASTILDRECDKRTGWIKEAVHIRKEECQSLNRD